MSRVPMTSSPTHLAAFLCFVDAVTERIAALFERTADSMTRPLENGVNQYLGQVS